MPRRIAQHIAIGGAVTPALGRENPFRQRLVVQLSSALLDLGRGGPRACSGRKPKGAGGLLSEGFSTPRSETGEFAVISRLDLITLAVIAGVLFITKPSQADVEASIKEKIITDIKVAQVGKTDDFLSNFLTLTCKFDAESCYRLARAGLQVSYKDRLLFSVVGINSNGQKRNCVGAFKNLFCPSFLN